MTSKVKLEPTAEEIERVADAINEADVGYRMTLTRLVDGVYTYELVYDGEAAIEFDNTDDLYAHVAARKREAMASAAILAMDRRASPRAPGVAVKPLEWRGPDFEDEYFAGAIGGNYTISREKEAGRWLGGAGGYYRSVDDAKAAAQADYEQRIRSALVDPAPAVAVPDDDLYDRGRRDILNAFLALNPEAAAKLAALHEREPDPEGRLPFDVVFWVTFIAEQLGIQPKEGAE